jgi:ribonuclease BN (tRNA processing enzyme)
MACRPLHHIALSAGVFAALVGAILAPPASAQPATAPAKSVWITLGTNSGPIPNAQRAEASNLLHSGDQTMLVDVGDAVAWQAAKAGYSLANIQTVLISHLHFDHTGGLFAVLSQRYQMGVLDTLTIYGPPGTQATVDGLTAAMVPAMGPLGVMRPLNNKPPKDTVKVVEIADGSKFSIGAVKVTAAQNAHFSASPQASTGLSVAYRFDLPDRSIVYTGDTGPSPSVERLAEGVDMLVSEITFDQGVAVAHIRKQRPGLPESAYASLAPHFEKEHLMPPDAGLMAAHAHAKSVVFTHDPLSAEEISRARGEVAQAYAGPVTFAKDLDRF